MDFKLYVIKGKENAGKTNACWKLLHKLKDHIAYTEYWDLRSSSATFDSDRQVYVNQANHTCDFVIIIRTKITHEKIAIISAGDEAWLLKQDIFHVLSKDVTTIVCCSRTINRKNSTVQMLNQHFKEHIMWSKDITYTKDDILKAEYEEEIANTIYTQIIK
ncbi:MAG: hypothetical protein ACI3Z5_02875 [Paludibacteraceae bacterium]